MLKICKFAPCSRLVMRNEILKGLKWAWKETKKRRKNLSSLPAHIAQHSTISSIKLKKYFLKFQNIFTHTRRLSLSVLFLASTPRALYLRRKTNDTKKDENFFFISDSISSHLHSLFTLIHSPPHISILDYTRSNTNEITSLEFSLFRGNGWRREITFLYVSSSFSSFFYVFQYC